MQFFLPLVKADQEKRLVYARAAVEEPDKAREIMDYATAVPQFRAWSTTFEKATLGKSLGNIRAMHNPKHLAGKVQEIVYNDGEKAVDVCIKVLDPVDWHKVEEGGYTGLSIGGGYLKKWTDPATGCTRYTPRIAEISFVDSPCIPSARILELQKADGSIEEVLLKGTPRTFAELAPPPTFADLLHKAMVPRWPSGEAFEGARSAWQFATSRGKNFVGENVSTGPAVATRRGKTFKPGKPAEDEVRPAYTTRGGKTFKQEAIDAPNRALNKSMLAGALMGSLAASEAGGAIGSHIGRTAKARKAGEKRGREIGGAVGLLGGGYAGHQLHRTQSSLTNRLNSYSGDEKWENPGGPPLSVNARKALDAQRARHSGLGAASVKPKAADLSRKLGEARGVAGAVPRASRSIGTRVASAFRRGGPAAANVLRFTKQDDPFADLEKLGAHPGFARAAASIEHREGVSADRAGAILAAGAHKAGKSAIRRNPRLRRVGGVHARKQELIDRLQKDFLTEPDNTISQWQAGRSDQTYAPNPFTLHQNKNYFPGYGAAKQEPLADLAKRLPKSPSSPEARAKIHTVLHEFKHGGLRSYRGVNPRTGKPRQGPKVTDRKQAIAIALNQARRMGKAEPAFVAALAERIDLTKIVLTDRSGRMVYDTPGTRMGPRAARNLTDKEHAQRIAAAKARWVKEGHPDLDAHHDAVMAQAKKSILGRAKKVAAVQQQIGENWHSVADAMDAHDKMRPHAPKSHSIMMEVPHAGGLLYNPEGIGSQHFDEKGVPKKRIYLMHPHEVDDWIAKHGMHSKTVRKDAPYGVVIDIDDLFNPPSTDEERLEKFIIPAALGLGAAYMGAKVGARTGANIGAGRMMRGLAAGTATDADLMGRGIVRSTRAGAIAGAVGGGAAGVALGRQRTAEPKRPKAA